MYKYKVILKSGAVVYADCQYFDIITIEALLNERNPFIKIGDTVLAKEQIAVIQKITEEKLDTTEKEN